MGSLTPEDIGLYVKCPILFKKKRYNSTSLTFFEEQIKQAFVEGEKNVVLKDSIIDPRKLSRAWDKIWFPAAVKEGISIKDANRKTLEAMFRFTEYCKYDISGYEYPTAGVDIDAVMHIKDHYIAAHADLLKIDLSTKQKTTVIVNFSNRKLSTSDIVFDPAIRTTAYAFYRNNNDYVMYVNVNIDENLNKLNMAAATFSPDQMDEIRKMIYHVELGIRNNVFYHNTAMCERCRACPVFKSSMKKDIL
jgi:hypothetical protein